MKEREDKPSSDGPIPLSYKPTSNGEMIPPTYNTREITQSDINISVNGDKDAIKNGRIATEKHVTIPDVELVDKKKKAKKAKTTGSSDIGFFALFRYTNKLDVVLLVLGTVAAFIDGAATPFNFYIFGQVANGFIMHSIHTSNTTANSTTEFDNVFDYAKELALYFCFIGVGSFICAFIATFCFNVTAERQIKRVRKRFFRSVLSQHIGWFDTHESGELSARFSQDMHLISEGLGEKASTMIKWITTFILSYAVAFYSVWKITLATVAFCPLVVAVGGFMTRRVRNLAREESESYAKAGSVAEEALSAIKTVMAFNGQDKECQRYNDNLDHAKNNSTTKGLALGFGTGLFWILIYSAFSVAFWFGTKLMRDGEPGFEPGSVLTVFFGVLIGSFSLGQAFPSLEIIAHARGAASKVYSIIEQKSEIDSLSDTGVKPTQVEGNIEYRGVQFTYPARPDIQVLNDLSLNIKVGQTVALVGPSGCGKSTVIQLLQRFYDPSYGQILLDGKDIKDLNVTWLRQQIGVVSQEPVLFATTISENIRYGRLDVTQDEIEKAATEANAHDFIKQLPKGYETLVGEHGAQMSGGQKQRIAIARALVRNPRILLLDEATSALDNESESIVQKALEKAQKGRTTIVVAHRLSTIRNADIIYGIIDGEVAESGTHEELMNKHGLYYQLVTLQTHEVTQAEEVAEEILEADDEEEMALLDGIRPRTFSMTSLKKTALHRQVSEKPIEDDLKKLEEEEEELPEVPLKKILKLNAPEWYLLVIGCISATFGGCSQPAFSMVLAQFIKVFSLPKDEIKTVSEVLVGIVMGIGVLSGLFRLLQNICFNKAGAILTMRFRKLAFKSIVWQDAAFYDHPKNRVGALTTKLASDATLVSGATGTKIGTVLESLATITAALVIAFVFSWRLSLVVLTFMPFMIASGIIHAKSLKGFNLGDKSSMEEAGKICTEAIDNVRTVVSLTRESEFLEKYNIYIDQIYNRGKKKSAIQALLYAFSTAIVYFAYAGSFTYGAYLVQNEGLAFENVFRVFGAVIFGGSMVGRHITYGPDYNKGKLAAASLFAMIEKKPQIEPNSPNATILDKFTGEIELKKIKFSYPSRPDVEVLHGLCISVNPGETIALVGASGCGKSTTIQLIERFYDPTDGEVTVDGKDIKQLNLQWLRSNIGVVSQEPVLFDLSIAENIAYGDNSRIVEMNEIIGAARNANIHKFIDSLPYGYETNVGSKGTQLSGGQKQRVAIARALIRNPKVLLLDEATSALDTESEKIVQDALDKAREGRTCIVIAHRLSTIQNCDRIAIVHKGEIVELGSHAELLNKKGIYYNLHQHSQHKIS